MPNRILSESARRVLVQSTLKGNAILLPPDLVRDVYEDVDRVLRAAGGRWKRGKGHVFERNAEEALARILETGVSVDVRKQFQAFYTPIGLANDLACYGEVDGMDVLEPSAGHGAICDACKTWGAREIDTIDLDSDACKILRRKGYGCEQADFLEVDPRHRRHYPRIIMNPPFTRGMDYKHISHALKFLAHDGILVSVCATGASHAKIERLLAVEGQGQISFRPVPAGVFQVSGTMVPTSIAILNRT